MRKALFIIAAVAVLGMLAAYVNPLGPEKSESVSVARVSSPASSNTISSGTATAQSSGYKDGTYQGGDFSSQYGDVQISVIVEGGKISGVNFDQLTAFDDHSRAINDFAAPRLKHQTLATQSASIDGVSGATYTSQDYIRSLQSALDKART